MFSPSLLRLLLLPFYIYELVLAHLRVCPCPSTSQPLPINEPTLAHLRTAGNMEVHACAFYREGSAVKPMSTQLRVLHSVLLFYALLVVAMVFLCLLVSFFFPYDLFFFAALCFCSIYY